MKFNNKVLAVDLFCGVGGLTKGLEKAGIKVNLGIDIDPACKYPYSYNNSGEFLEASIQNIKGEYLDRYFKPSKLKLLAGCAPCQTFSTYNPKSRDSDERWWLLNHFSRLVKECQPELVTMENVPGLIRKEVFHSFISELESEKYIVSYEIIDCAHYGLPQSRKRLVLFASKFGAISLLSPKEFSKITYRTVRGRIGKLPSIKAGECDDSDPLHKSAALSTLNLNRIKASRPGGSWRDWPSKLVAECHKSGSGETYVSVYGRMSWDAPSPAMTTQFYGYGNGRFGHPCQNRAISLREGAMLQGFSKCYRFVPPENVVAVTTVGRLIGNAVPVTLGQLIGKSINKHVEGLDG